MPIQVQPFDFGAGLKNQARADRQVDLQSLALQNRQQQQGIANQQRSRQLDLTERGQNLAVDQNKVTNKIRMDELDAKLKKIGLTRQELALGIYTDAVDTSPNADVAARKMRAQLAQIGIEMDPAAEEALRNEKPEVFGSKRPAAILDRENLFGQLPEGQRGQAAQIEAGILPRAATNKVTNVGNVPNLINPNTGETQELVSPTDVASNAATVKAGEAAGKDSIAASKEARDELKNVRSTIANIGDAIQAIDKGASSGAIASRLPSIKTASLQLENAQRRLGLNIIGATTFGALSKGELDLALETAVPTGLQPTALREWLVNKQSAQTKLADELERTAIFLGTPGNTVAEYMQILRDNGGLVMGGEATEGQKIGRFTVKVK